MKICWARNLGGCGGGFSKEHIISDAILKASIGGNTISGEPFTEPGIHIPCSRKMLKSNILCANHNSRLSPVDQEGANVYGVIDQIDHENAKAQRNKGTLVNKKTLLVNGPLIERWFLKTSINFLTIQKKSQLWFEEEVRPDPPLTLLQNAFGISQPEPPMGLYSWGGFNVGDVIAIAGQIHFRVYQKDEKWIAGTQFFFQGLHFLWWFRREEPPWAFVRQFRHHMGGDFQTSDKRLTHELRFTWPAKIIQEFGSG